jgi:hypothetical protein
MKNIDAGLISKNRHGQMMDRSDAARTIGDLAGLLFGERNKFGKRARFQLRIGDQDCRHRGERGDRREILDRIVANIRIERGDDRHVTGVAEHQGVAIGRRLGSRERDHGGSRALDVLDDDGLTEIAAHSFGQKPSKDIGIAAWSRRYQQPNRVTRIRSILRARRRKQTKHNAEHKCDDGSSPLHVFSLAQPRLEQLFASFAGVLRRQHIGL